MKKIKYILLSILFSLMLSKNSLNVISYNVHGFPGEKNKSNILEIIDNILSYDMLFIQENWRYNHLFSSRMNDYKFIYSEKVNKSFYSSGLMIGFKKDIDLIKYDEKFFSDCNGYLFNGSDCLAYKGFIYLKVNYKNIEINVINTHLDSGSSIKDQEVRSNQLNELKEYIINNQLEDPIIMCGDFNIDFLKNEGNKIKNFISDLNLNFVEWSNEYFLNKIDYIFYSGLESIQTEAKDVLYNLSDHPPMQTLFNFIK